MHKKTKNDISQKDQNQQKTTSAKPTILCAFSLPNINSGGGQPTIHRGGRNKTKYNQGQPRKTKENLAKPRKTNQTMTIHRGGDPPTPTHIYIYMCVYKKQCHTCI